MAANARNGAPTRRKTRSAALQLYRKKRNFSVTSEPSGDKPADGVGHGFVIQKHAASHLHYDFRLEMDGVLKSWALAKGPSVDPAVRRLAIETEDHPQEYGAFEGVIPNGQYGGGTVMVWDSGTWHSLSGNPQEAYASGHLKFRLEGHKLHGQWALVRMKPRPKERHANWLLIKDKDDAARPGEADRLLAKETRSAKSGRTMEEIARGQTIRTPKTPKKVAVEKSAHRPKPALIKRRSAKGRNVMPSFIPPALAIRVDRPPAEGHWLHEIKFDGYRLHARLDDGQVTFLTRRGQDWTRLFAEASKPISGLPCQSAYIDTEAVVLDKSGISNFGALQATLKGGGAQIVLYAFDLLFLNGEDLRQRPLTERKAALNDLLRKNKSGQLRYSDHQQGDGDAFFKAASALKVEGIISKDGRSSYHSDRTRDWLKIKRIERQEFVIVGFQRSNVDRAAIGSLLLGERQNGKFRYVGKVGTGYTASSAKELYAKLNQVRLARPSLTDVPRAAQRNAVWVAPRLIAEIEFGAWTNDHILRHGSFIGLRYDKSADQVKSEAIMPVSTVTSRTAANANVQSRLSDRGKPIVRGIGISHPNRLIYPNDTRTKLDVARYYERVADVMLPHIRNRPLALVRCPDGVGLACFFQKHIGPGMHKSIHEKRCKGDKLIYVDSVDGIIGLVQYGVQEIHVWGSRIDALEHPDWVIFDFDPDASVKWHRIARAALDMHEFLMGLGLTSYLKTTGGKGLHVVVPLQTTLTWDEIKAFSRAVAEAYAARCPKDFTVNMSKKARVGRIFIDYLRNGRGATAVAPYSTRARPGGLVATPITWKELEGGAMPTDFTIESVTKRTDRKFRDPWALLPETTQSISAKMLAKLKTK